MSITRAITHCYWYVERQDAQGPNIPKASDRVPKGKPFFEDVRGGAVDRSDKR